MFVTERKWLATYKLTTVDEQRIINKTADNINWHDWDFVMLNKVERADKNKIHHCHG